MSHVVGTDGNDLLEGGVDNDTLEGGAGADTLIGGAGHDVLLGGEDADVLDGGTGDDVLDGGDGSDTYLVGRDEGFDTYQDAGASGEDRILAASDYMAINLISFGASNGIEEIDADGRIGVEIAGDDGDNVLDFSTTRLVGIAQIGGGAGEDTITGSVGDDLIAGGIGDDVLDGGEGSDTYLVGRDEGFDTYQDTGASGEDRILAASDYMAISLRSFGAANGIEEINADGRIGVVIAGDDGDNLLDFSTTRLVGIDEIGGGAGNDTITGSVGDDLIAGGMGDDALDGGEGSDTYLVGRDEGFDTFGDTGASGEDRIRAASDYMAINLTSFGASNGIEEIDADGRIGVEIAGDDGNNNLDFSTTRLVGIAQIGGGAGNDMIVGSTGDDVLAGGMGDDGLDGGDGSDTYLVGRDEGFDTYQDTGASGEDRVLAASDYMAVNVRSFGTSNGIEEINADGRIGVVIAGDDGDNLLDFSATRLIGLDEIGGGAGNDTIAGSAVGDRILGGAGDDSLEGGAGADTLDGGAGSDTASYAGSANGVTVNLTTGVNTGGDAEGDVLTGIENLAGSDHADQLTGDVADNTLMGGAGADILDGGAGSDTAVYATSAAAVTVNLSTNANAGGDAQGDVLTGIENLVGSAYADLLTGDSASNTIRGGAGDDTVVGGAGADTLDGGSGSDTAAYTASSTGVMVDLATGVHTGGMRRATC